MMDSMSLPFGEEHDQSIAQHDQHDMQPTRWIVVTPCRCKDDTHRYMDIPTTYSIPHG